MKKLLIMVPLIVLLSGCYSDSDGCFGTILRMNCPPGRSDFDSYTKKDENKVQKLKDITACGGVVDKYGDIFDGLRASESKGNYYGGPNTKKFVDCIHGKGYVFIPR